MTRFCTKCGASVADDALFCDACGNPMRKPAAATAVTSGAETTQPVAKAPRFSGRALAIAGGVAAIVVVAAGGIA